MVDYSFSSNLNKTISGFNPASDVLLFSSANGSAADVTVTEAGGATTFRTSAGTVTLSGVSMAQLSPTNVNFANGSRLYVGDGTTATLLDSLGQAAATYVLSTANDHVQGLGGNDSISIAEVTGNDKVNGNAGDDNITVTSASTGNHNIWGGAGVDTISIEGSGANHVFGDNGNNLITITGSGANQANGNADNDSISVSGGGANIVRGGKGTDTLTLGATATGTNQAWGDDGADSINIIAGANVVYGDNGADTITGVFTGGAAVLATVFGGADADTFRLSYSAQAHRTIIGDFASTDIAQVTLSAGSATSLAVTGGGSSPTITNGASEQISFSGYTGNFNGTNFVLSDSTILATNFGNTAGTLTGGALADHLIAGNGGDVLNGAVGADKMLGGSGNDMFIFTTGTEHAAGETIIGGGGFDTIRITGSTASTMTVTSTTDVERIEVATIAGVTTGTTAIDVNASATTVWGGTQTGIWIQGNSGINSLSGSDTGNDTIIGGIGEDYINWQSAVSNGNDVIGFLDVNEFQPNNINSIANFNMNGDRIGFSSALFGQPAGAVNNDMYAEAGINSTAGNDDLLVTAAVNALANLGTIKILVLVDIDAGANTFYEGDIDLGLKNSNAVGSGFILAQVNSNQPADARLYYDPNFDNYGDIVDSALFNTTGNHLTLANAGVEDFIIL